MVAFWAIVNPGPAVGAERTPAKPGGQAKVWKQHRQAANEALKANDWDGALQHFQAALAEAEGFKPDDERLTESLDDLGTFYGEVEDWAQAEALHRRALELRERKWGPQRPEVVRALSQLGFACAHQAKFDEAEQYQLRAKDIAERKLGPYHPVVGAFVSNLAVTYALQCKYEQAERAFLQAASLAKATPEHTELTAQGDWVTYRMRRQDSLVAGVLQNLATVQTDRGEFDLAAKSYQEALKTLEGQAGKKSPYLAPILDDMGRLSLLQKDYAKADVPLRRALALLEKAPGPTQPYLARTLRLLVRSQMAQGTSAAAAPYRKLLAELGASATSSSLDRVPDELHKVARCYAGGGRLAEAEGLLQRLLASREQVLGPNHPETAATLCELGRLRALQTKTDEAAALLQRAVQVLANAPATEPELLLEILNRVGDCYRDSMGRPAEAEAAYRRLLETQEKLLGQDHPDLVLTLNEIAEAHLRQNRPAPAVEQCRRALAIQEKLLGPNHRVLAATVEKLITAARQGGQDQGLDAAYDRMVKLMEQAYGADSLAVANWLGNYAEWLRGKNRAAQAQEFETRARKIRETPAK